MTLRSRILGVLVGLSALALLPASAGAAPAVSGEFPLARALNANNRVVEGPDGNIWVTLTTTGAAPDVARIDPQTGKVDEFNLPGVADANGIAAADGKLWITQDGAGATGLPGFTSFKPEDPPNTASVELVNGAGAPTPIVRGADGNLWMAIQGFLVRIQPNPIQVTEYPMATTMAPKDIDVVGSSLAIADFDDQKIFTATAADPPVIDSFTTEVGAQGVAGAPGGQIAFSQPNAKLGLFIPPGPPQYTPSLTPPATPTDPFGVALGPDGGFWFAQFAADTVTRLSTDGKATSTLSPGFAPGAGPRQISAGPNHTLWVTLEGSDKVARIGGVEAGGGTTTPPPPPRKEPETRLDRGLKGVTRTAHPRAKVSFAFSSSSAGAGFECRLAPTAARKGKRTAAPGFSACRSPKAYRLAPGRYRFEVRAVLAGLADRSPATASFKVVRVRPHRHR
jgi:streptogramin lyase